MNKVMSVVTLLGLATFAVPRAQAIPAFSRTYKTECATCHTVIPHRNAFGEAFRRNGYVWPGAEGARKPAKGMEALWRSGALEAVPVSLLGMHDARYDREAESGDKLDLEPHEFELMAGGSLRDRVTFWMEYRLEEVEDNEREGTEMEEAFVMFRRVLGTPLNVKYGLFRPDLTLWKHNDRLTAATWAPLDKIHGEKLKSARDGVEMNGVFGGRLFAAVGAVDREEQDGYEFYGHVAYKFGGTDLDGNEPEIDLEADPSVWDDLAVTLSAYGYVGRRGDTDTQSWSRVGAEAEVVYKGVTLLVSGLNGRDEVAGADDADTWVYAAEAQYVCRGKYFILARYEYKDEEGDGSGVINRFIPAVGWTPVPSVRLSLEHRWEKAAPEVDNTTLMRLLYSF